MIRNLWLKIKRFILPYPLAYIGKFSVKMLLWTCRIEVKGISKFKTAAAKGNCILMLWHNRMALTCEFFNRYASDIPYAAFLSKSRDGEPIARIVQSYPNTSCIRVSHANRHNALRAMIARLKNGLEVVIITPDGPRGPRYKIKEGIVHAAKTTSATIIPYTWEANRYWHINTWDLFRIPRPFSKITILFGEPILLTDEIKTVDAVQELENALHRLINKN